MFSPLQEKTHSETICSILEMAITGIVPKIVGVALRAHAREQAVQLAVRVILNFLPNSLTQVHTTIL